jgi:hypothetical protein
VRRAQSGADGTFDLIKVLGAVHCPRQPEWPILGDDLFDHAWVCPRQRLVSGIGRGQCLVRGGAGRERSPLCQRGVVDHRAIDLVTWLGPAPLVLPFLQLRDDSSIPERHVGECHAHGPVAAQWRRELLVCQARHQALKSLALALFLLVHRAHTLDV